MKMLLKYVYHTCRSSIAQSKGRKPLSIRINRFSQQNKERFYTSLLNHSLKELLCISMGEIFISTVT